jgi:HAD superfamily phosphoserine phosphatase-like hydrolase
MRAAVQKHHRLKNIKNYTGPKQVVLSDVDGTVVRGSLVLQHAISLHETGIINLGDLPAIWRSEMKNEHNITNLAVAYQQAITGMKISDLNVEGFIDSICENSANFYSSLARLVALKQSGAEVVLVSGSPDFLVGNFGNRFGFSHAASKYITDSTGILTGMIDGMFSAPAKRAYVSSLNLTSYRDIFAFGDTSSDVPLFEAASYSVLVDPNEETRLSLGATVNEIVEN